MKTRIGYETSFEAIASVIRAWDPYALLAQDCPADEFDSEISKLVAYVPGIANPTDAARAISQVFSAAFEPHLFTPAQCAEPGEALFANLVSAGLVAQS